MTRIIQCSRQSKIAYQRIAVQIKQDIGRLDIPVKDPAR